MLVLSVTVSSRYALVVTACPVVLRHCGYPVPRRREETELDACIEDNTSITRRAAHKVVLALTGPKSQAASGEQVLQDEDVEHDLDGNPDGEPAVMDIAQRREELGREPVPALPEETKQWKAIERAWFDLGPEFQRLWAKSKGFVSVDEVQAQHTNDKRLLAEALVLCVTDPLRRSAIVQRRFLGFCYIRAIVDALVVTG